MNRHNVCSRDKCLRRNDGSICTTCKYMFPKDLSDSSVIKLKYYDNLLVNVEHTNMSNDSYMNTRSMCVSLIDECNNDKKGVESVNAAIE